MLRYYNCTVGVHVKKKVTPGTSDKSHEHHRILKISLSRSTRKARKIQATPRHGSSAPAAASWRRRAPARGVPCIAGDAVVDVGVNWGSQLSHPLLPSSVVKMLKANSISKVKLFDADHWPVDALVDSSIEVMLRILRRVPTGHQRPHD
jgi:hypothetical protein